MSFPFIFDCSNKKIVANENFYIVEIVSPYCFKLSEDDDKLSDLIIVEWRFVNKGHRQRLDNATCSIVNSESLFILLEKMRLCDKHK